MTWLNKILPSRHTRDALFALTEISENFSDEYSWRDIEAKVRAAITENQEIIKRKIVLDGMPPANVVFTLVAQLCFRDLEGGSDHTYRGTLGMIGRSKRSIYLKVVQEQRTRGWIDDGDAIEANRNIAEAIKDAG